MNTTHTASTELDQEELLHLAIEAMRRNDHGSALAHLKVGAQRFPAHAGIAFLLGAEHAQLGLFERAEVEFIRAINLDPNLSIARFQLGLLQLTQARLEDARTTWAGLDSLSEEHALRLFKQGLEAMAEDHFAEARTLLERGIIANNFNPDLNNDMQNVLDHFPKQGNVPDNGQPASTAETASPSPVWFNAYQNSDQGR